MGNSRRLSGGFVRAFAANALRARGGRGHAVRPLILTYFVTFRCNLKCTYCEYIADHFAERFHEVPTRDARRILTICRQGVPSLAFSGGEPLVRTDIEELVHHARLLGFSPLAVFTNALLLPDREAILDDIDYLQISLDSLDEGTQSSMRRRPGLSRTIVARIQRYAPLQKEKRFRLNINCVLTPANLGQVDELLRFAASEKVRCTFCPQLRADGLPDDRLTAPEVFERYVSAVSTILAWKRSTAVVMDIVPFLRHIQDARPGRCSPWLTPRVYPDGSVRFPCSIVCRSTPNVLARGSWSEICRELAQVPAECPSPCLLPCYLETSLLVQQPWCVLQELRVPGRLLDS